MKTLQQILEGLLDTNYDVRDNDIFGKISDFISALEPATKDRLGSGVIKSFDKKCCTIAEQLAKSKEYDPISHADAKNMIIHKEPGTILTVNWTQSGGHNIWLINPEAYEFVQIWVVLGREHSEGPWICLYPSKITDRSSLMNSAFGYSGNVSSYLLPNIVFNYFKKALAK